jgi:cytidylate kinase
MPQHLTTPGIETPGSIIILSGPPGSGKTTVGRILAETAERPTVHLVTDNFYVAIKKGFIAPFLPQAARQNEVVIGVIVESMLGYVRGGYDVVVDGIIGPWSLPAFVHAAGVDQIRLALAILRPSLEQTLSRAKRRAGMELKASGPIKGLYQAFENLGVLEKHVIDSSSHAVEATVEHVRAGVCAGRLSVGAPPRNS